MAYICCSVKPSRSALFEGQTATQVPQPMHRPGLTRAVRFNDYPLAVADFGSFDGVIGTGSHAGETSRAGGLVDAGDFRLAGDLSGLNMT